MFLLYHIHFLFSSSFSAFLTSKIAKVSLKKSAKRFTKIGQIPFLLYGPVGWWGFPSNVFQHKKQPREMKNETDTMPTVMLPRAALTKCLEPSRVFDLKPCNGKKNVVLFNYRLTQSTTKCFHMKLSRRQWKTENCNDDTNVWKQWTRRKQN